ncbi:MAG: hypothetical protein KGL26_07315 [Pseudomonadota bacterium]|nr:hypothetical protein [Pseudomonadota bacterium]
MTATRRALLIAPLALCAVGGLAGAAAARGADHFTLIEDGAGPAARAQLATLARQWQISQTIRVPARSFINLQDLRRRLDRPGTVRMILLARASNHLLGREAIRDAGGAVLFDGPLPAADGFGVLVAQVG